MSVVVTAIIILAQALSSHSALASVKVRAARPDSIIVSPVKIISFDREEFGPVITAQSAVAVDATSGAVLFGKRPQVVRPLASITKLITAITLERTPTKPSWETVVTIVSEDIPPEGHTVLIPGDRVTLRDLRTALIVGSDNAAANAIARAVDGTNNFVRRMQEEAKRVGSTFQVIDPAGLRAENIGSSIDIAHLAQIVFTDHTDIRSQFTLTSATISAHRPGREGIVVRATNELMRDPTRRAFTIVGGKTGYLDEAGYNLVLDVERDHHLVTIVVLGSATNNDRFRDARITADWVFKNYKWSDANDAN